MPIAILILVLVGYGYALIAWPEFRRPGLICGLVAAAGLGLYFLRHGPESERAASRISPAEVTLDDLAFARTLRGATLTGRVHNRSAGYRLRDLTLALRLRDCPAADTPPETCPVIGEATAIARPDAPPGQIRGLAAHFIFNDLPPLRGTLRWDWEIVDLRATPD